MIQKGACSLHRSLRIPEVVDVPAVCFSNERKFPKLESSYTYKLQTYNTQIELTR